MSLTRRAPDAVAITDPATVAKDKIETGKVATNTTEEEATVAVTSKEQVDKSLQLQAILAVYNAMRGEIVYRSDAQKNLLQIHITALTVIIGGILGQVVGQSANQPATVWITAWVALVIPIESAIFAFWWLDHALAIVDICAFIRVHIEKKLSEYELPCETFYKSGIDTDPVIRLKTFKTALLLTFIAPSFVVLFTSFFFLIISLFLLLPQPNPFNFLSAIAVQYNITNLYRDGSATMIATLIWIIGLVLLLKSHSVYRYYEEVSLTIP